MLLACKVLEVKKFGRFTLQNWAIQLSWMFTSQRRKPLGGKSFPVRSLIYHVVQAKGSKRSVSCFSRRILLLEVGWGRQGSVWAAHLDGQLLAAALIYTHLRLSLGKHCLLFSLGTWRRVWIPVSQIERLDSKGYVQRVWSLLLSDTDLSISHPHSSGQVPSVALPPHPLLDDLWDLAGDPQLTESWLWGRWKGWATLLSSLYMK